MAAGKIDKYTDDEREAFAFTSPFKRELSFDDPKLPYRSSKGQLRISLHHGQRKLLLSEIEFLTLFGRLSKNIVYAGAAPGFHIPLLAKLFSKHTFYLYDPARFGITATANIHIFQEYFTNEIASQLAESLPDLLFICDIRRPDDDPHKFEENVLEDMTMQMHWTQIMRPMKSMLKFRFPYHLTEIEYLDGRLFYQAWAPVKSGETRLVVDRDADVVTYSLKEYEDIIYRFNTVTRQQVFAVGSDVLKHTKRPRGFDGCYDCSAEVWILSRYLKTSDPEKIIYLMNMISTRCKRHLDTGYHGLIRGRTGWDRMVAAERIING